MIPFKKNFTFKIENDNNLTLKLKQYFQFYSFEISEEEENSFVFFKKSSILSGWKYNPLNWESKVKIHTNNNILEITYTNEGNSQITPFAFDELFTSFFQNLELHINKSIDFKEKNNIEVQKAKKRIVLQFLILILSILSFALISQLLIQKFRIRFIEIFGILIGAFLSLKFINQYWINKTARN